jgi:hypothetical protein
MHTMVALITYFGFCFCLFLRMCAFVNEGVFKCICFITSHLFIAKFIMVSFCLFILDNVHYYNERENKILVFVNDLDF